MNLISDAGHEDQELSRGWTSGQGFPTDPRPALNINVESGQQMRVIQVESGSFICQEFQVNHGGIGYLTPVVERAIQMHLPSQV